MAQQAKARWRRCRLLAAQAAMLAAAAQVPVHAQNIVEAFEEPCVRTDSFSRPGVNGPYDYRTANRNLLNMVESNHFAPQIENLIRGKTGTLASELSFVLHGFPNHHRALVAMSKYGLRENSPQPGRADYSVDCYFQRAMRFRPDDLIVRMLYADHLGKTKRDREALTQLDFVKTSAPDNPLTQYNLGLLYFQIGRYAEALAQAHRAIGMGMVRPELKAQLVAKGKWSEPPAAEAAPAASAPASAASSAGS